MWRSERARNDAILELLRTAHLYHPEGGSRDRGLWTDEGPTEVACRYIARGSPLSHGEHLVLQVAFDLWNGGGRAKLDDLLTTLDERLLRAVCLALLARDGGAPVLVEAAHG